MRQISSQVTELKQNVFLDILYEVHRKEEEIEKHNKGIATKIELANKALIDGEIDKDQLQAYSERLLGRPENHYGEPVMSDKTFFQKGFTVTDLRRKNPIKMKFQNKVFAKEGHSWQDFRRKLLKEYANNRVLISYEVGKHSGARGIRYRLPPKRYVFRRIMHMIHKWNGYTALLQSLFFKEYGYKYIIAQPELLQLFPIEYREAVKVIIKQQEGASR